jgi:hypothetical protein
LHAYERVKTGRGYVAIVHETASGDGPRAYAGSRLLRLAAFCLVVSALLVSAFVVVFRFVWDRFLREALGNKAPYQARIELLLPAMLLIAFFLGASLWRSTRDVRTPKADK